MRRLWCGWRTVDGMAQAAMRGRTRPSCVDPSSVVSRGERSGFGRRGWLLALMVARCGVRPRMGFSRLRLIGRRGCSGRGLILVEVGKGLMWELWAFPCCGYEVCLCKRLLFFFLGA